jgi:hypothetical protein
LPSVPLADRPQEQTLAAQVIGSAQFLRVRI